jgi:tetratricopeptide (TPR) repeat protein
VGRREGTNRSRMRLGLTSLGLAANLLLLGPLPAAAEQDVSLLEHAERLADRGETREARQALARWQGDFGETAPLELRARGWFLAARLAEEGAEAEINYLRVIIEGSATQYADDALLRLGQYKYARGEHSKTVEYLGRLRRDYPTSEHGSEALLWIARAARELGDSARACSAAGQGLLELPPGDTLLQRSLQEEEAGCRETVRTYSVQVAAFQDETAAQNLARELLRGGFDAWVLNATPQDPLYRVRVGRGLIEAEAEVLLERLVVAGYSPFLVSQQSRSGGSR